MKLGYLTSKVKFSPKVHFFEMDLVENPDKLRETIQQFVDDLGNKKTVQP